MGATTWMSRTWKFWQRVIGSMGYNQPQVIHHLDVEPKIGVFTPQNGWCYFMEDPIKMDDQWVITNPN